MSGNVAAALREIAAATDNHSGGGVCHACQKVVFFAISFLDEIFYASTRSYSFGDSASNN
jgi:hypothetical protein